LALEQGYADPSERNYHFFIRDKELDVIQTGTADGAGSVRFVPLKDMQAGSTDRWGRIPFLAVDIHVVRADGSFALPARVIIGQESPSQEMRVLGWAHAPN
jgi:hypothetical protein